MEMVGQGLLLLVLVVVVSCAPAELVITPKDHVLHLEVGDELVLNCTIVNRTSDSSLSSRALVFEFPGGTDGGTYGWGHKFVTVLSENTSQLRYPNIAIDVTDNTPACKAEGVEGVKRAHAGHVYIARPPLKPSMDCVVYNWERMECVWEPSPQDQISHTYLRSTNTTFEWTATQDLRTGIRFCDHGRENKCVWEEDNEDMPFVLGWVYHIEIIVKSVHSTAETGWITKNSTHIVKPDPVTDLKVTTPDSSSLVVGWTPPTVEHGVVYTVAYKSQWEQLWKNTSVVNDTEVTLTPVTPHSSYTVVVSCMPESRGGFQSEEREATVTSMPAAPAYNPTVIPGGFQILEDVEEGHRKVKVFWQPLEQQYHYGDDLIYEVRYSIGGSKWTSQKVGEKDFQAVLNVGIERLSVEVRASNSEGPSTVTPVAIDIPSSTELEDAKFEWHAVAHNESLVSVEWEYPTPLPLLKRDVTQTRVTVYWCKGDVREKNCEEPLQWQVVDLRQTPFKVVLPRGHSYRDYMFGVSTQNETMVTPLQWAHLIYDVATVPCPPSEFKASPKQDPKSVSVQWSRPLCPGNTAYIKWYTLSYCETEDNKKCSGHTYSVTIPKSASHHKIPGLKVHVSYRLWMHSVSYKGDSATHSGYITMTTKDKWLTTPVMVAFIIVPLILLPIVVVAVIYIICKCRRVRRKFHLEIKRPDSVEDSCGSAATHRLLFPSVGFRSAYRRQTSGDSGTESLGLDDSMISFNGHANGTNPPISPITMEDVIFEESDEDVSNTNENNEREYTRRISERGDHVQSYQLSPKRDPWKALPEFNPEGAGAQPNKPLCQDLDDGDDEVFATPSPEVNDLDKSCDYALVSPVGVVTPKHSNLPSNSPPEPSNREYANLPADRLPPEAEGACGGKCDDDLLASRKMTTSSNSLRDLNFNNNCERGYVSDDQLNAKQHGMGTLATCLEQNSGESPHGATPSFDDQFRLKDPPPIRKAQNNIPGGYITPEALGEDTPADCHGNTAGNHNNNDVEFDNGAFSPGSANTQEVPFSFPIPRPLHFGNIDAPVVPQQTQPAFSVPAPVSFPSPKRNAAPNPAKDPNPASMLPQPPPPSGYVSLPTDTPGGGTVVNAGSEDRGTMSVMPNPGYVGLDDVGNPVDNRDPPTSTKPADNAETAIKTGAHQPAGGYVALDDVPVNVGNSEQQPSQSGYIACEDLVKEDANSCGSHGDDGCHGNNAPISMPGLIPPEDSLFGAATFGMVGEDVGYSAPNDLAKDGAYVGGNGDVRPTANGDVRPAANGDVRPAASGYVRPAANGDVRPTASGYVRPAANGDINPANPSNPGANGYIRPAANGDVRPAANGDVRPAASGFVRPAANGDVRPAANGDVRPAASGYVANPANPSSAGYVAYDDVVNTTASPARKPESAGRVADQNGVNGRADGRPQAANAGLTNGYIALEDFDKV